MSKNFSVIIPVHNEGFKPIKLLRKLENTDYGEFSLTKICLVASGKTERLERFCDGNSHFELTTQEKRLGKASAINAGLERIKNDYILMVSGDVLPAKDTVQTMLEKLEGGKTGVVTGHPVPKTDDGSFTDYFVNLVWKLHDFISREEPKAGEILAFKNLIDSVPEKTAADEEFIKTLILEKGLGSKYARDAIVYNRGPSKVNELFEQRRRIYIGHLDLKEKTSYSAPSMSLCLLLKCLFEYTKSEGLHPYLFLSMIFETLARADAWIKYNIFDENPYKWEKVS